MTSVSYMWKAIVAGLGAAVTSVTAIQAAGAMTWQALAIAVMGAVGTGLATFAKSNTGQPPTQAEAPVEPKPDVVTQNIPGWTPPTEPQPADLPTGFPQ